ncbi:carbamate kinase [Amycolatopsis jejuensis]|uniref:carbamate kinase n=1 Tax=Amycolatopsis jejuensis TaxID=330084 RepID=UPI000526B528|nr:carbamate kinase [Amycolatopsis jejuensis]
MKTSTIVVAVGGNALVRGSGPATIGEQFAAARRIAVPLAGLVRAGRRVVLTHGNGPQVGYIQRRSDLVAAIAPDLPRLALDMCVADSQGSLGYILASALAGELRARGLPDRVAALVTHTVVDPADPAFSKPSKPIGIAYPEAQARELAVRNGWTVVEDSGRGWRRVVPSPRPRRIVEEPAAAALLDAGFVVIAAGGGGIPVVEEPDGRYRGIEAVIDKDFASAVLADDLDADLLAITTGVPQVSVNFGRPDERSLGEVDVAAVRRYLADGQFPPGSMGPKMEAAVQFLSATGVSAPREVLITSPDRLEDALRGETGTRVRTAREVDLTAR